MIQSVPSRRVAARSVLSLSSLGSPTCQLDDDCIISKSCVEHSGTTTWISVVSDCSGPTLYCLATLSNSSQTWSSLTIECGKPQRMCSVHRSPIDFLLAQMVSLRSPNCHKMHETWVEKIPWRRKWQPTPVFLPGESHGRRTLAGYSPWGRKETQQSNWTELNSK